MEKEFDVFISYQYSGIHPGLRKQVIDGVTRELKDQGQSYYCSLDDEEFFRSKRMSNEEIYAYCLDKQKKCDRILFVFIAGSVESAGMKKELDLAQEIDQKPGLRFNPGIGLRDWMKPYFVYTDQQNKKVKAAV